MKNVVLYVRVANATELTADRMSVQEEKLRAYCETHGYNVVGVFTEVGSWKLSNKPRLNELFAHIERNILNIDAVIVTTWDRYSRDIDKTLSIINKFEAMGVEVLTSNQNSEIGNDEHSLALFVYRAHQELLTAKNTKRHE